MFLPSFLPASSSLVNANLSLGINYWPIGWVVLVDRYCGRSPGNIDMERVEDNFRNAICERVVMLGRFADISTIAYDIRM